jgi:hypothetical protein
VARIGPCLFFRTVSTLLQDTVLIRLIDRLTSVEFHLIKEKESEPSPFDPKWLSEKFNGPGVKYEVAICIQTGWIVHTNDGPYPCGQWHDLTVARDDLCYKLADSEFGDEMACADGGYADGYQFFETPTGHNNADQRMKAEALELGTAVGCHGSEVQRQAFKP